jgi:lipoyl-dependent peroxiredoxin
MITRKGNSIWTGGLKDGSGEVSTQSGALKGTPYSFARRFGEDPGTNPEELIAAAHASCFGMFLSGQLGAAGLTAERIETTASVSLDKVGEGFEITRIHLDVVARIPGATKDQFEQAANNSKAGCPISKLLSTAEITMNARLEEVVTA